MNSERVHPTPGLHLSKSNQFPHGKTEEQEVTEMLQICYSAGESYKEQKSKLHGECSLQHQGIIAERKLQQQGR